MTSQNNDPNLLVNTVIALDVAFRACCEYLHDEHPIIAKTLYRYIDKAATHHVMDAFPIDQATAIGHIVRIWQSALIGHTSVPNPPHTS